MLLPSPSVSGSVQGVLLGSNIYLKATNSSIPGFKTVSPTRPTGSANNSISLNVSASGSYLIDSWILPWIFSSSVTISSEYNFLFCMYGNGSGLATFYGELLIYRDGAIYQSIFKSLPSSPLSVNASDGLLWQSKTNQNITFLLGDRLVFRLYLKAENGLYTFWYDSLAFPSYFTDPTETRYFTTYTQWYKTINVKNFSTANSVSYNVSGISLGKRFGIRVWKTDTSETETEITSGSPVATVIHAGTSDDDGEYTATWLCPETALSSTDRIVVRVYSSKQTPTSWSLIQTFITEPLGANKLNSGTWTVYYWLYVSVGSVSFFYGSSAYNSRLTNFVWTPSVSKTWNYIIAWQFTLIGRSWILVAFSAFTLISRIWNPISSWIFFLNARSWQNINLWTFSLRSPGWNSVSSWIFSLETLGWHSIAFWIFSLTPFSTGFLLIPIIFLVGVVLFLMVVALGKKFHNEF
jgi:hypothetical protein